MVMNDRSVTGQQKSKQRFTTCNSYIMVVDTGGLQEERIIENDHAWLFLL